MTATAHVRPLRSVPVPRTDGAGVELRPLAPGDSAAVLAVFAGLGARSRELRFLTRKPRLSTAELRRLTAVDRHDHVALLASSAPDREPVGIARFVRDEHAPESAEAAVAVVDSWQRRGVGTVLLRALVERALEAEVRRFTVFVSNDNVPVLRMLHRFPGGPSRVDGSHGVTEYTVSLEGGPS